MSRRPCGQRRSSTFSARCGGRGYAGANVTLPHKEAALAAADRADHAAAEIGAANTLWLDAKGLLHASNTDAYGFMTHLSARGAGLEQGRAAGDGARRRRCRARHSARVDRSWRRQDPARQPHRGSGEGLGKELRPACFGGPVGGQEPGARRLRAPGQCHEPRHDGKAAASPSIFRRCPKTRSWPTSSIARSKLSCSRRQRDAETASWMGSACCCIRPFLASSAGSASARR